MKNLFQPLSFKHGAVMKNRFMLAPMTNLQSFEDGRLSDEEFRWLTMRAQGGFGLTMTCASHVQAVGKGFPGQLGCFSDDHLTGLSRLASAIRAEESASTLAITIHRKRTTKCPHLSKPASIRSRVFTASSANRAR